MNPTVPETRTYTEALIARAIFQLERIAAALETIAERPAAPAAASARVDEITFQATSICVDFIDGKPAYRAKGDQYNKFGIRIWEEIFPLLGIDPATLKPGSNPISLTLRARLNETGKPKKIVGLG